MNQDFGLALTPANARRLLRFQQTFAMVVPEALLDLAMQDSVTEDDFDPFICEYTVTAREITQFLLDCKLRAIIQQNYHPSCSEVYVMNAVRLAKPQQLTIVTNSRQGFWMNLARWCSLDKITEVHTSLSNEVIDRRRSGVLIYNVALYDKGLLHKVVQHYAIEFAQCLVFENSRDFDMLIPWSLWAEALSPTMPNPLYARVVNNVANDWCNIPLHKFAAFYNVCLLPELISEPLIAKMLSDQMLLRQLRRYRLS